MENSQQTLTPAIPIEQPIVIITMPDENPIDNPPETLQTQVKATSQEISTANKENVDKPHTHTWSMNGPVENQLICICGAKENIDNPKEIKTDERPRVGRPCKYCLHKEHYLKIAEEYLKRHEESEKPKIPFIEELALKMRVDDETLVIWAKKVKKDVMDEYNEPVLEHPELSATYALLRTTQKFRLKQRAMGRYNPVGALSLLRFDHGAIETSKQVHAGDPNEPLQITIIEEDRHVAED